MAAHSALVTACFSSSVGHCLLSGEKTQTGPSSPSSFSGQLRWEHTQMLPSSTLSLERLLLPLNLHKLKRYWIPSFCNCCFSPLPDYAPPQRKDLNFFPLPVPSPAHPQHSTSVYRDSSQWRSVGCFPSWSVYLVFSTDNNTEVLPSGSPKKVHLWNF